MVRWACGLTRIRGQFVVYLCLHRGKSAGKHGKLASPLYSHFAAQGRLPAVALGFWVKNLGEHARGGQLRRKEPTGGGGCHGLGRKREPTASSESAVALCACVPTAPAACGFIRAIKTILEQSAA